MRTAAQPLSLVLGVLSVLAGDTASAVPRHQKPPAVEVQPLRSNALARSRVAAIPARPLSVEKLRMLGLRISALNERAIATLRRLIDVTPDDTEKPDLLFRLAELYREQVQAQLFRARELDDPIFRARSTAERARLEAQQRSHGREEQRWLRLAVELYLRIGQAPAFQSYRRIDEVLFHLADLIQRTGRREQARHFFQKLIRNHPQSRFVPDAILSFAEHAFEQGKIEEALRLYEQVGRFSGSALHGYALYKQGWCWLNLKDPRRALELFVRVIQRANGPASDRGKLSLLREARRDAVRAYSQIGAPEHAWRVFVRIGGKDARRMLEQLADLYTEQGKHGPSIQSYRRLLALDPPDAGKPASPHACRFQHAIVKATVASGAKSLQRDEARGLLALALRAGAPRSCRSTAGAVIRELATVWHREAQRTADPKTYALAGELYTEYLKSFPEAKDRALLSYYQAELLYTCERWAEAGEAYTRTIAIDPKGKYVKDAALGAAVAWQNALEVVDRPRPRPENSGTARRPIPERERKMLAAFDLYLRHLSNGKEASAIRYRRARVYYDHNHHPEAVAGFSDVVAFHPEHELAPYAGNLLLDALNILERYDELNTWVRRLLANERLLARRASLKGELEKVLADSERGEAERLQKAGRYPEAAERYVRIANRRPDDPRWPELLHNAALCYEAAKQIGMAIAVRITLISGRPEHRLAKKALHHVGANYHALAWYSRAADFYERFALKFPGETEAPAALQNAIVFRLGRGETERALEDARVFARSYAGQPRLASRAAAVVFSLGQIHEGKDPEATVRHYASYLQTWGARGGIDRQIRAHVAIAEARWRRSCSIAGALGACLKISRVEARRSLRAERRTRAAGQCGPETRSQITLLPRSAEAAIAQRHFGEALALHRRAGALGFGTDEESTRRSAELRHAVAAARFHQAEERFESFVRLAFPANLDFSSGDPRRAERSRRVLATYLEEKTRALARAAEIYREVITLKAPHYAIAASARIGQLHQSFADALFTAPVPEPPIPPALARSPRARREFLDLFRTRYCDTLTDEAGPLAKKAEQGLKACLNTARDLSWYNEWSSFCESELHQLQPATYPLASEIRAQPNYVSLRADRASLVTTLR